MNTPSEKHIFALIWNNPAQPLINLKISSSLMIDNPDLCHRLQTILRLNIHDQCIFFTHQHHALVEITAITKKNITVNVLKVSTNKHHHPTIICGIPLLKREALETVVDSLTQLGATTIQLLTTAKMHRSAFGQKDLERLQRIINAAAEQSKNFSFPRLQSPIPLNDFVSSLEQPNIAPIFFDPHGKNAFETLQHIKNDTYNTLVMLIGPEGDLNEQEKTLLKNHNFIFMALTPTILRAEQAIALGLGIFRSFL